MITGFSSVLQQYAYKTQFTNLVHLKKYHEKLGWQCLVKYNIYIIQNSKNNNIICSYILINEL